ncbi:Mitochondrial import receptor subunit TOM5-like protein [Bienertia sinuspersici]
MAEIPISVHNLERFWNSQVHDRENWALNMVILQQWTI